jgi:hypothetical protein
MKIANLREAAVEWTVTIEGPDEFGESGKNSGVLCGSEQRRGWLKDRVEGQRRQVGLVPEPLS